MSNTSDELSERELEILRLVATGASNKEIASQLYISANTVKVHLRNIFTKINASSRTEAAMYAINQGLVPRPGLPIEPEQNSPTLDGAVTEVGVSKGRSSTLGGLSLNVILLAALLTLGMVGIAAFGLSRQATSPQALPTLDPTQAASPWQALAPLPEARFGLAAAEYQGQIYAIGGETPLGVSASVACYDPVANSWDVRASKPTPAADIGAAVLEGKIYAPGGRLSSGEVTDILEIYDPLQDRWSQGASLPKPLSAYALVAFEGKLYLFGGFDGRSYVSDVYAYEPGDDAWQALPAMDTPRGFAGAAVSGRQIVLVGGYDGKRALLDVDLFQPDFAADPELAWKEAADLPGGRYAMGVTSVADFVYLVGGSGKIEANTQALVFSPQINQWQSLQQPVAPLGSHIAVASLGSYLYTLGGVINRTPLAANYSYKAIYMVVLPIIP